MNKKEIIEEVVVSDSASTNNTLGADGAVGEGCLPPQSKRCNRSLETKMIFHTRKIGIGPSNLPSR